MSFLQSVRNQDGQCCPVFVNQIQNFRFRLSFPGDSFESDLQRREKRPLLYHIFNKLDLIGDGFPLVAMGSCTLLKKSCQSLRKAVYTLT